MAESDYIVARIDIRDPLDAVLASVARDYSLGDITSFSVIETGYQDCNVLLTTASGKYVVKIFRKGRTQKRIEDVLGGHEALKHSGVPLPTLLRTKDNRLFTSVPGTVQTTNLCVFEFFEGAPLTETPPGADDLTRIASSIASIHLHRTPIDPWRDELGIMYLPEEFFQKQHVLTAGFRKDIGAVVEEMRSLPLEKLPRSLIHGSVEKENILKSADGSLCLLDLGCMEYQPSVTDIATAIVNFTDGLAKNERDRIIRLMLNAYRAVRPLNNLELDVLPILVRAQCAAYILGMTYHQVHDGDQSVQTETWLQRGISGLAAYQAASMIVE